MNAALLKKAILGAIALSAVSSLHAQNIITDPWDSSNPLAMPGGVNRQILPKAFEEFAPSGNFLRLWGFDKSLIPPNPTAVDTAITGLVRLSTGQTTTSKNLWNFAILMATFGLVLSGVVTYNVIASGRETPGLGTVKWLGKSVLTIILVSYVAAAMPKALITICDNIMNDVTGWLGVNPQDASATSNVAKRKISTAYTNFLNYHNEIRDRIDSQFAEGDPARQIMLKAVDDALAETRPLWTEAYKKAMSVKGGTANEIKIGISKVAVSTLTETSNILTNSIENGLNEAGIFDSKIRGLILDEYTVELSDLMIPQHIIGTAIYVSVVYLATSIWGMPVAILFWAILFSMPSQWGMDRILLSGIKILFGVVLTCLLVMAYVGATMGAESVSQAFFLDSTGQNTSAVDFRKRLNGTTVDLAIAAALIASAPAQAAGILSGANAIAENAKNAIANNSYGLNQAFGNWGKASIYGGQSMLSNATTAVRLSDFQSKQSPSRRS